MSDNGRCPVTRSRSRRVREAHCDDDAAVADDNALPVAPQNHPAATAMIVRASQTLSRVQSGREVTLEELADLSAHAHWLTDHASDPSVVASFWNIMMQLLSCVGQRLVLAGHEQANLQKSILELERQFADQGALIAHRLNAALEGDSFREKLEEQIQLLSAATERHGGALTQAEQAFANHTGQLQSAAQAVSDLRSVVDDTANRLQSLEAEHANIYAAVAKQQSDVSTDLVNSLERRVTETIRFLECQLSKAS